MQRVALFVFAVTLVVSTACGPSLPPAGQYDVQKNSVHFDGERYQLTWLDPSNQQLHNLDTRNLKMVRDDNRTYLEVPSGGDPTLHLREDEPITVDAQDRQGGFSSFWFPFFLGSTLGGGFGRGGGGTVIINNPAPGERASYGANTAAYRYPPTGSFGRDEQLHGSLDSGKPQTPDYSKVQPAPYATSGANAGTGSGTAASNKAPTTSGSAASSKGTFKNSPSAPATGIGGGSSIKGSGSSSKPSLGGGSKGIGGSRAPSIGRR
jgi:hypothetical protein